MTALAYIDGIKMNPCYNFYSAITPKNSNKITFYLIIALTKQASLSYSWLTYKKSKSFIFTLYIFPLGQIAIQVTIYILVPSSTRSRFPAYHWIWVLLKFLWTLEVWTHLAGPSPLLFCAVFSSLSSLLFSLFS